MCLLQLPATLDIFLGSVGSAKVSSVGGCRSERCAAVASLFMCGFSGSGAHVPGLLFKGLI